jgi:hypothetical protein
MNGLVEYGVSRGTVLTPPVIIDDPEPPSVTIDDVVSKLTQWILDGKLPTPAPDERSLLFMMLMPTNTKLPTAKHSNTLGFHQHNFFGKDSGDSNLFWAEINTTSEDGVDHSSGRALVQSVSTAIAHETAEACTDPDGKGFHQPHSGAEICDRPCGPPRFAYGRMGWDVPVYWSNWHNRCIHGDRPVSMTMFLKAISSEPNKGLKKLGASRINLEFMASAIRALPSF